MLKHFIVHSAISTQESSSDYAIVIIFDVGPGQTIPEIPGGTVTALALSVVAVAFIAGNKKDEDNAVQTVLNNPFLIFSMLLFQLAYALVFESAFVVFGNYLSDVTASF